MGKDDIPSGGGGASRTTEPAQGTSAATDVSLREHLAQRLHETERRLDDRFRDLREADWRFAEERDRRYAEVAIEKEKALRIKETADLAALGLAREIQQYKDTKANELREQINAERGLYPTRLELAAAVERLESLIKPITEFMQTQSGRDRGVHATFTNLVMLIAVTGTLFTIITYLVTR